MSARGGWLERLLDWAVGASRDDRVRRLRSDDTPLLVPAREPATDDRSRHDRRDHEREMELRVLMSTWM